ncbi:putative AB hydrolase superfamily protein YfhM [Iris pallida]|uniref:AB hydrolase superfamily protein YfhM n=1 Tax=Iris pallida TaxID=29817 RepID=A0AAX6GIL9_IRIPA|nr:putative AB hydrolase superfamily protein YfhM [Iris pallida]
MEQEEIQHSHLHINGLGLHVAQLGKAEKGTVVFLHGFPEIWYSWRHQMVAVAGAGYRAVAPDCRGYGLSDQPPEPENANWHDLVADLVGILDVLSVTKAFVVAKDFGAMVAYHMAVLHPERVSGLVTMGIPYFNDPAPIELLPPGFYIVRWQQPGRAEADFSRFDIKTAVRNIYILFCRSELQVAAEDQEIMDLVDPSTPLPSWFSEDDLAAYAALYEKSGFRFPMQIPYMKSKEAFDVTSSITNPKVEVPTLLIMGEKDYFLKFPFMEDYIRSGKVMEYVPDLETIFLSEGCHFVQEQLPEQVNQILITFLSKVPSCASN